MTPEPEPVPVPALDAGTGSERAANPEPGHGSESGTAPSMRLAPSLGAAQSLGPGTSIRGRARAPPPIGQTAGPTPRSKARPRRDRALRTSNRANRGQIDAFWVQSGIGARQVASNLSRATLAPGCLLTLMARQAVRSPAEMAVAPSARRLRGTGRWHQAAAHAHAHVRAAPAPARTPRPCPRQGAVSTATPLRS
jgi:hypothetical protein